MNPPDGEGTRGGDDFGVYRERYNGLHTGEDWSLNGTRSNGAPVYAIGHGLVTYAQPRGWGRDGGVVIVQHTLADWSRVLSFYGHLAPASVRLRVGDCVQRGEVVGTIGDRQHLHFEIRLHMPKQPGPGYWSVDPTLAGWLPPSKYIWESRMKTAPGVEWLKMSENAPVHRLGMLNDGSFALIVGEELVGIEPASGEIHWLYNLERSYAAGGLDADGETIYLIDRVGNLAAYHIPEGSESTNEREPLPPLWQVDFEQRGSPHLLPLPQGGVIIWIEGNFYEVSLQGEVVRLSETVLWLDAWASAEDGVVFTTADDAPALWQITDAGLVRLANGINGIPIVSSGNLYIYGETGVYRYDRGTRSGELVYPLERALTTLGDALALPDGGLLLAHRDGHDQRLLALNPDGSLRWEYSYAKLMRGQPDLIYHNEDIFMVVVGEQMAKARITLVQIDPLGGQLLHLFDGETPDPVLIDVWIASDANDTILINLGGGMLGFNPLYAQQAIAASEIAQ
jgi:hypothetical protein